MDTLGSDYPALYRDAKNTVIPIRSGLVVGRGEHADYTLNSVNCSRRQFRIQHQGNSCSVEPLSQNVPTLHNGQPLQGLTPLVHGDRIEVETYRFVFLEHTMEAGLNTMDPSNAPTLQDAPKALGGEVRLGPLTVVGRGPKSGLLLPHPAISRSHAEIKERGDGYVLRDLGSQNGSYVNGTRLRGQHTLVVGDRIDIGPYTLSFTGHSLIESSRTGQLRVVGRNLTRRVNGAGGERTILDNVSVVLEPGELTCLIGPSGSGKTTLMNALCARNPANDGDVRLNGVSLYAHFEVLKQGIALVPQHELLHENLTVFQAVEATARLRLPPDTERAEIHKLVEEALAQVELAPQAQTRVARLSGGQRKRASLANEIVCKPEVLFLDEVTSGLDESTDREIMKLFRELARSGTTVVCVTHTLANVNEFCHKLVVMAEGGALAFVGSPQETVDYFGVTRLADVYGALAEREAGQWADAFATSKTFAARIAPHLDAIALGDSAPQAEQGLSALQRMAASWHQLLILSGRYGRVTLADTRTQLIALAQAAVIAVIIGSVFHPDNLEGLLPREQAQSKSTMLFLLGICAVWFGCNNAAKEIVKERPLYRRERDVNLSVWAYLASKLGVLWFLGALQVLVLATIVAASGELPTALGPTISQLLVAMCTGTGLGLLISSSCSSEDQAAAVVPMAVLPQILLA
ncbi:MAG: ABC-type multidrug transport system ATPase subunit, partial [Pseudohongiellaceae bacterium]